MYVTISDIVRESGYSKTTVSRVARNDPNVKPETRRIIQETMDRLGYRPNEIARGLVTGRLRFVMIITGDITNYFIGDAVDCIEKMLYEVGYMTVVCNCDFIAEKETSYIKMAMECRFAGIILMSVVESPGFVNLLKSVNCPVVMMNRYLPSLRMDAVVQDNYQAAYCAAEHLIKIGHRRIIHFSGHPGATTTNERIAGFRCAMENAGIPVTNDMVVMGELKLGTGYQWARELAARDTDVSAVLFGNDSIAVGFIRGWYESGKSIPDDISVISFDYTELLGQMRVNISTVGCNAQEMGTATARLMLERLAGDDSSPRHMVFKPLLNTRNSVKSI